MGPVPVGNGFGVQTGSTDEVLVYVPVVGTEVSGPVPDGVGRVAKGSEEDVLPQMPVEDGGGAPDPVPVPQPPDEGFEGDGSDELLHMPVVDTGGGKVPVPVPVSVVVWLKVLVHTGAVPEGREEVTAEVPLLYGPGTEDDGGLPVPVSNPEVPGTQGNAIETETVDGTADSMTVTVSVIVGKRYP